MRSCFDVRFYDLDLEIKPKSKSISGTVEIKFEVVTPTKQIQLELASELVIHKIGDDHNRELNFVRRSKAIIIDLNEMYESGAILSVFVTYSGKPQIAKNPPWKGGFVCKNSNGNPFMGVACEDDGASIWWPLKDHISDKPDSVRIACTIPKGLFCVSNGKLIEQKIINDDCEKFIWQTSYPVNTYNITFYIGDYRHFQLPYKSKYGEHQLDFYVLPKNLEKAKNHFKQCADVIRVYEELFGEYPWWKDGYKMVESPFAGMEHQSAIAYGNGFKNNKWLQFDYIIVHETAHEWWGNKITVCDMADLWIHEGFATYSEALFVEKMGYSYGYGGMIYGNRFYCKNKMPVVGPSGVSYINSDDGDIYSKGSMTLHSLRYTIDNDTIFFNILYRFATEYGDNCVTTSDFVNLVNEATGEDYSWLFNQFLYRREAPELVYRFKYISEKESAFMFKWNDKNTNDDFKLPLYLYANNEKIKFVASNKIQEIRFQKNSKFSVFIEGKQLVILTLNPDLKSAR